MPGRSQPGAFSPKRTEAGKRSGLTRGRHAAQWRSPAPVAAGLYGAGLALVTVAAGSSAGHIIVTCAAASRRSAGNHDRSTRGR